MIFQFKDDKRFPEYYRKCAKTGVYHYKPAKEREYANSYFLEEYSKQYRKSYYEDEPNIRELANTRLDILNKYLPDDQRKANSGTIKLLEVGCAAGFFLDEARKRGYSVTGIEISESAAEYARQMHLNIVTQSIYDFNAIDKFNIICGFFVIEHFGDLETILEKLKSFLLPGGLFFFGIPSAGGPTFLTNPEEWFKTHPIDHFYDFTSHSMKKTMRAIGMKMIHCSPMSFHQERDRGIKGKLPDFLYKKLAKMICYGDTIHVIAKNQITKSHLPTKNLKNE